MNIGGDEYFKGVKIPDNMKERFNGNDAKIVVVSTKSYCLEDLSICINHPYEEGCLKDSIDD